MTQRPLERNEQVRWRFLAHVRRFDPDKLVFLDETSIRLGMQREYGYAPVGERVHREYLRNYGLNRTLLSAVSLDGVLPSLLLNGSATREAFEHYLAAMLLPMLSPGQVLVLDNYVIHKRARIETLVREAGCNLMYLPAYSPDLNPIEMMFSKVKTLLAKTAALTLPFLSLAVRKALDAVSLSDIQGFLRASGYELYL